MMVRDEAAIVADSLGHLLHTVGMDRIYVADDGSVDETPEVLRRIAAADLRVRVTAVAGAYRPTETLRGLAAEAMAEGADWLLPVDADEFPWLDGAALRRRCAEATGIGAFRLHVRNFVQLRRMAHDRPGSTETMLFSAVPSGTVEDARTRVCEGGLPYVRMAYPPKLLLRAAPGLCLLHGNHHAGGLAGGLDPGPIGELLHAPIRSRGDLDARVLHGRRAAEAAPDPRISWHLKRVAGLDAPALDAEWRNNSLPAWYPFRPGFCLDLRLRRLALRLRGFRASAWSRDRDGVRTTWTTRPQSTQIGKETCNPTSADRTIGVR